MATSKILKEYIVEKKTSSAESVAAQSYKAITISVAKSGYKPLGVLGISKVGATSGYCLISNLFLDSSATTLTVGVMNVNNSLAATITITVDMLYERVGGVIRSLLKALQSLTFRTKRGCA